MILSGRRDDWTDLPKYNFLSTMFFTKTVESGEKNDSAQLNKKKNLWNFEKNVKILTIE